jgi:hypothetical protein
MLCQFLLNVDGAMCQASSWSNMKEFDTDPTASHGFLLTDEEVLFLIHGSSLKNETLVYYTTTVKKKVPPAFPFVRTILATFNFQRGCSLPFSQLVWFMNCTGNTI